MVEHIEGMPGDTLERARTGEKVSFLVETAPDFGGLREPVGELGHRTFSTHAAQNVHSSLQIRASSASGGRSLSHSSRYGRSSSTSPGCDGGAASLLGRGVSHHEHGCDRRGRRRAIRQHSVKVHPTPRQAARRVQWTCVSHSRWYSSAGSSDRTRSRRGNRSPSGRSATQSMVA